MMKILAIIPLLLPLSIITLKGQNLIPNHSFEQFESCPTFYSQFDKLVSWFNPTKGTPDYYNVCATEGSAMDVPNNAEGQQYPRSGRGYGGIINCFYGTNYNYREYIEVALLSPLIKDSCYHFEMYVNLGVKSHFTTNEISAYFSDSIIWGPDHQILPLSPQISNVTGFITDTLNWVAVSGEFIADGGESYVIIGNFVDDNSLDYKELPGCCFPGAYFFIDDVSLLPCTVTGLNNIFGSDEFNLYPNPAGETAVLEFNHLVGKDIVITLYNVHGQSVLTMTDLSSNKVQIELQHIPTGIYYLQMKSSNQIVGIKKVLKL